MRWETGRRSSNIEDRRGASFGRPLAYGGGAVSLIALVLSLLFGGQGTDVDVGPGVGGSGGPGNPVEQREKDFASVVLADTEDTWPALLRPYGVEYVEPSMVLFSGATQSGCGFAQSAMGPFYCPRDERVYLDLGFFQQLEDRFGAPGDFARAYVIAHEVGHHVQNLLGISDEVQAARSRGGERQANALSVRLELQADCFAGIWAREAQRQRNILEPGDVEEGLNAAAAVGDDTLQKAARGHVVPESFTHGSAKQRASWFDRGFTQGTLEACDTFRRGAP